MNDKHCVRELKVETHLVVKAVTWFRPSCGCRAEVKGLAQYMLISLRMDAHISRGPMTPIQDPNPKPKILCKAPYAPCQSGPAKFQHFAVLRAQALVKRYFNMCACGGGGGGVRWRKHTQI